MIKRPSLRLLFCFIARGAVPNLIGFFAIAFFIKSDPASMVDMTKRVLSFGGLEGAILLLPCLPATSALTARATSWLRSATRAAMLGFVVMAWARALRRLSQGVHPDPSVLLDISQGILEDAALLLLISSLFVQSTPEENRLPLALILFSYGVLLVHAACGMLEPESTSLIFVTTIIPSVVKWLALSRIFWLARDIGAVRGQQTHG